jgi:carboxylesterase
MNRVVSPALEGAEPFSASNGPDGVLVLHGFSGTPRAVRPLAEAFADAGYSVDLPLLPGHGTSVADLVPLDFDAWSSAADEAHQSLAARCNRVMVAGLSMGGTLALLLAEQHPETAGVVLVNPLAEPLPDTVLDGIRLLLESGVETVPSEGSDIALPGVEYASYATTPIGALLSLSASAGEVVAQLGEITCPVLLLSSRTDHVVPPSSGDAVVAGVGGPVERVWLERSYHVATLDFDQAEIEQRSVDFAHKVFSS